MSKNPLIGITTDAVLGGGIRGKLESWKQHRLETIGTDIVELRSSAQDLQAETSTAIILPDSIADAVCADITGNGDAAASRLSVLQDQKLATKRFQVAFQVNHNIDRQPTNPDPYDGIPVLVTMAVVEGVATSGFFFGGGFVSGIGEAAILGLTISSVNVVLSAGLGGFAFGRYWNYGAKCREPETILSVKRWSGRVGAVLTAGAIGTLLIASGIVRATGDTEHLSFTFERDRKSVV